MSMSKKSKIIIYVLLTIMALYFLSPFVYMLFTTFKTEAEAIAYPPKMFPKKWLVENYLNAWNAQPFGRYLWNSIVVTVGTTAGQIISCSLVAYGFARYNFKGKNVLFMILLSTMMIPWDVTMIPQYMEFKIFGWINTLKPLIVPAWFGSAYYIFLMRQFLMGVPKDFEEAARIDGASELNILLKIMLPMAKPVISVLCIFSFMWRWNDYLWPKLVINGKERYTIQLALANYSGEYSVDWNSLLAMSVISMIPVIIVFVTLQKYIIGGMTAGGVKE